MKVDDSRFRCFPFARGLGWGWKIEAGWIDKAGEQTARKFYDE